MNPLLAQFISETRELLEATGKGLLAIESDPKDSENINQVFRAAHTIKGSSGLFEFKAITSLVHAAEDLLDALRSQEIEFEPGMIDLLLDSFDCVNAWMDDIERAGSLPDSSELMARDLGGKLRAFLGEAESSATTEPLAMAVELPDLDWIVEIPENERILLYQRLRQDSLPLFIFSYTPHEGCFFSGEDPLYLVRHIKGLGALRIVASETWPSLAELDAYRCVLRFMGLVVGEEQSLKDSFRYVLEQVRWVEVAPQVLVIPAGEKTKGPAHEDFIAESQTFLERGEWPHLTNMVRSLKKLTNPELFSASALRWLEVLLAEPTLNTAMVAQLLVTIREQQAPDWQNLGMGENEPAVRKESSHQSAPERIITPQEREAFIRILDAQEQILNFPYDNEYWSGRIKAVCRALQNCLDYLNYSVEYQEEIEEASAVAQESRSADRLRALLAKIRASSLPRPEFLESSVNPLVIADSREVHADESPADKERGVGSKILKIDQQKIDQMMDLIGELVVAKNSLPYLSQRAERVFGVRDLSREIKDQYAVINRIAQEMQASIMQIRMMPVANVFQRFPRMVRDLSRKLDKQVKLVVEGEDTEADKNVIELLVDPLMHILRNSLDHGVETPEEWVALGKPAEACIHVKAYRDEDSVAIEIRDDGRGIDPKVILDKALEHHLLTPLQAETLSGQEIIQYIFAPGLSTADEISDISGRGVGMDVVRSSVERVGGTVRLSSELGIGTTVRLSLPLSMAVVQVMGIEVDGRLFGVPIDCVVETVRLPRESIYQIKHREAFLLRDRLVPLVRLKSLLSLPINSDHEYEEVATLVVRHYGENIGVIVDNFREGMEIILKPMEGVFAGLHEYTGTALLGDGSVLLVLNLKELL
jgi:two-component system chemotaxis sensor kinase CheA